MLTNNTSNHTGVLDAIEELRIDAKVGKVKHFNASDRKMFWHRLCGVPVIIANLLVGIVLMGFQSQINTSINPIADQKIKIANTKNIEIIDNLEKSKNDVSTLSNQPLKYENKNWISFASIILVFFAASLSAIQTFFNFHKASEGHRAIGNRYTHISRQCKALLRKQLDIAFDVSNLWSEYEKIYEEYNQINTEAEAFPTNSSDLKIAKNSMNISPFKMPNLSNNS